MVTIYEYPEVGFVTGRYDLKISRLFKHSDDDF